MTAWVLSSFLSKPGKDTVLDLLERSLGSSLEHYSKSENYNKTFQICDSSLDIMRHSVSQQLSLKACEWGIN